MSELVARLAVQQLRLNMFPKLPQYVQDIFPSTTDPLVNNGQTSVPNIVVGTYQDYGVNAITPMVAVDCSGAQEGLVNVWRHLNLSIDIWIGGNISGNVDGRRVVSIIYEYINRALQNVNWSGKGIVGSSFVQIERSYETEKSAIMFDASAKIYRIANVYRVEALSQTWY